MIINLNRSSPKSIKLNPFNIKKNIKKKKVKMIKTTNESKLRRQKKH